MNNEINYKNNPLHGVGLKNVLTQLVDYYGFDILFAYLNINCFKKNPGIESSVKFLKRTDWAREKVEAFYLYELKNLPRASSEQFLLPPRERIIPDNQSPAEPAELSLEDAQRLREKREKRSAEYDQFGGKQQHSDRRTDSYRIRYADSSAKSDAQKVVSDPTKSPDSATRTETDPWARWKNKSED